VHVFEAQVLGKSASYEIEITCDTQFSVTHAAPPDVSVPAVSFHWRFAYAGPGVRGATIMGPASANLQARMAHILIKQAVDTPEGRFRLATAEEFLISELERNRFNTERAIEI
jgi:hypothetical protein